MALSEKTTGIEIPNTPVGSIWSRGNDVRKVVELTWTRKFADCARRAVRYVRVKDLMLHGQHYSRTISVEGWARWRQGAMRRSDLE